nr:hypothetical protein CFP56_27466 [Quercus suber]
MANGLLKKSNNSTEELEDIGEQYLKELLSRSYFQERLGQDGQIQFLLDVLGRLFSQKRMFLVLKIATAYQFRRSMQHRKSQPSLLL